MADAPPTPGHGLPQQSALLEFRAVMARLRAECGWKSAQTHRSLARYLLEETHETLEAIETGSPADLREELGDLLLQVYFHAAIAEEAGSFDLEDVAADVVAKMRRRNPHVFGPDGATGDDRPTDPAAVNELWESVKATEKTRYGVLDGIPPTLPALLMADKVLDRLGRAGETTPDVLARAEQASTDDAGVAVDLLRVVAGARDTGADPEQALRELARELAGSPRKHEDR